MNIDEAVKACRESQYTGWQMVTFVQKYVNKYMRFSLDNTSDAPRTAFSKGKGYSWQQAWCVHYILKKVNIRSELVYTTKADFYESRSKRQKIREKERKKTKKEATENNSVWMWAEVYV